MGGLETSQYEALAVDDTIRSCKHYTPQYAMIALRGIVEKSPDGRSFSWKGRWAFGSDVPAASPAALPFEYVWQREVDPASVPVPSVALQEEFDPQGEKTLSEERLPTSQNQAGTDETLEVAAKPDQDETPAVHAVADQPEKGASEQEVKESDSEAQEKDEVGEKPLSSPESKADRGSTTESTRTPSSAPAGAATPMETPTSTKKRTFTFADPMTPGDPPFTDASSKIESCPPSGEWKGFFETLPRKSGQPNVPIHEYCYLFLNATPPDDALVQFWDESRPPDETGKLRLPEGHVLVRGMGENQYGKFELIGSYNLSTNLLTCQRIYVVVPQPKSHRKRALSAGGGVGASGDNVSPSTGRPYRTRNKQTFSWKQRLEENTSTHTPSASLSNDARRKRSRSEGAYGSAGAAGGKRLKITIPDSVGGPGSALTPGSVGSDAPARPSPRGSAVHVARKANVLGSSGSVGGGTIKLANAGEPSKAHWRAAHFLYYHRETSAASGNAAQAATSTSGTASAETESGSTKTAASSTGTTSSNTVPKAVVYEGEMYHGQREGRGICLFNNGILYEGGWHRNKEHGRGVLMTADRKKVVYKGEWEKGKMHGRGVYYYGVDGRNKRDEQPGARYEGEFKESLKHGMGRYYFADGSVYDGGWRDNMMTGRGVFTWKDGSVYEGEWKDSKRHGQGILKASDGFFYDGYWVANSMEGRGTAVYPNGQKYIGLFAGGRREGRGTMLFTNGATYEGRFRDDAIDGQGTLRLSRAMVVPRENEEDEDDATKLDKPDFMIPVSFQSDMGHIHRTAGFNLGGE